MLDELCRDIEEKLAEYGVQARIVEGKISKSEVRIRVEPTEELFRFINSNNSFDVLSDVFGPDVSVLIRDRSVYIAFSRTDDYTGVGVLDSISIKTVLNSLENVPGTTVLLGIGDDGAPLLAKLTSRQATNILVRGESASMSSNLLLAMAISLSFYHHLHPKLELVLVGDVFSDIATPFFCRHSSNAVEILKRVSLITRDRIEQNQNDPLVIIIDDLDDLHSNEAWGYIESIVPNSRYTNIHLIIRSDRDDVENLFPLNVVPWSDGSGKYNAVLIVSPGCVADDIIPFWPVSIDVDELLDYGLNGLV